MKVEKSYGGTKHAILCHVTFDMSENDVMDLKTHMLVYASTDTFVSRLPQTQRQCALSRCVERGNATIIILCVS